MEEKAGKGTAGAAGVGSVACDGMILASTYPRSS